MAFRLVINPEFIFWLKNGRDKICHIFILRSSIKWWIKMLKNALNLFATKVNWISTDSVWNSKTVITQAYSLLLNKLKLAAPRERDQRSPLVNEHSQTGGQFNVKNGVIEKESPSLGKVHDFRPHNPKLGWLNDNVSSWTHYLGFQGLVTPILAGPGTPRPGTPASR